MLTLLTSCKGNSAIEMRAGYEILIVVWCRLATINVFPIISGMQNWLATEFCHLWRFPQYVAKW